LAGISVEAEHIYVALQMEILFIIHNLVGKVHILILAIAVFNGKHSTEIKDG
jgi:hypothetical protein